MPRALRTFLIGAGVELGLVIVYVVLRRFADGEALAAAMLGGELRADVIVGVLLVLLRLAVWVFVPMIVVGTSAYAAVLTPAEQRRPRSRTAPSGAPSPS